jgi:hypothetical protein
MFWIRARIVQGEETQISSRLTKMQAVWKYDVDSADLLIMRNWENPCPVPVRIEMCTEFPMDNDSISKEYDHVRHPPFAAHVKEYGAFTAEIRTSIMYPSRHRISYIKTAVDVGPETNRAHIERSRVRY